MYRYQAEANDDDTLDNSTGQMRMDNMGYEEKPPDPYRRPDVVSDNKPRPLYPSPYPPVSPIASLSQAGCVAAGGGRAAPSFVCLFVCLSVRLSAL